MMIESIHQVKKQLRQGIKTKLSEYTPRELQYKSDIISNILDQYVENKAFNTILCYYPIHNEVNILRNIEKWLKKGKSILLPKIISGKIEPVKLTSIDNMVLGKFGILEPVNINIFHGKINCAIVPGLIFSNDGKRIGKGFGYYDKYFKVNKEIFKLGVCYDFQMLESLENEDFDVNMDDIIYA